MITIATLFSGGEGMGVGARDAGLRYTWGIELDDPIAAVARANGFDVTTADVTTVQNTSMPVRALRHSLLEDAE